MPFLKKTSGSLRSGYALSLEQALALKTQLEIRQIPYTLYLNPVEPELLWICLDGRMVKALKAWLGDKVCHLPETAQAVGWEDLLALEPVPWSGKVLQHEVLIQSTEPHLLMSLISEHVRLGEGELALSVSSAEPSVPETWLLRIQHPSHWLLTRLAEDTRARRFLPVGQRPGLYLQQGYGLRHPRLTELFQWDPRRIFLLDSQGGLQQCQVSWQPVHNLIRLELPEIQSYAPRTGLTLPVPVSLIPARERAQPRLWRIDDPARLEALLAEASPEQLESFQFFLAAEGPLFCQMTGLYGQAGLAERLSEQFPAWSLLQRRVFLPLGRRLQPRLSEEELLRILPPLQRQDRLCLVCHADATEFEPVLLPEAGWQGAQAFVAYRIEKALQQVPGFAGQWEWQLGELVNRSRQLGFKLRTGENVVRATVPAAPAPELSGSPVRADEEPGPDLMLPVTDVESLRLRQAIRALDLRLLKHFSDAGLWQERAELCHALRLWKEALLCQALAAVVAADTRQLLHLLPPVYAVQVPALAALFETATLTEEAKGQLLGQIRQGLPCAEERYVLQLWYAVRCQDQDVFDVTIEAMRRGESVPPAAFHDFGLGGGAAGEGQVLVLNFADEPALQTAIARYRQILRPLAGDLQAVLLEQFRILLRSHHPQPEVIETLLPRPDFPAQAQPLWARKWQDLQVWPACVVQRRATAYWAGQIALPGLQGAQVQALFTGEAYRPDFTSNFRDEADTLVQELYQSYLRKDLPLPPKTKSSASRDTPNHWQEYFVQQASRNELARSRSQRVLLYLCQRYGPLADFASFVLPADYTALTEFSRFVRHCDYYRLCRLFELPLDETEHFPLLLEGLDKMATTSLIDFRDAAENLLSCLFLSRSAQRETWLSAVLQLILREAGRHADQADSERGEELLATVVYLELDVLLHGLSSSLENYQHFVRRRALWMEHAHSLRTLGLDHLSRLVQS